jgi:hypothetical protein
MILAIIAAAYRAGQELFLPKDVVLFPFLVLGAWILFLYWVFAGPRTVRRYNKAYKAWAREKRTVAYSIAILIGAVIGGATGAGWWKLFEMHRKQMARLKENSSEKKSGGTDSSQSRDVTEKVAGIPKESAHGTAGKMEAKAEHHAKSKEIPATTPDAAPRVKTPRLHDGDDPFVEFGPDDFIEWGDPLISRIADLVKEKRNNDQRIVEQFAEPAAEKVRQSELESNALGMVQTFMDRDYDDAVKYRKELRRRLGGGAVDKHNDDLYRMIPMYSAPPAASLGAMHIKDILKDLNQVSAQLFAKGDTGDLSLRAKTLSDKIENLYQQWKSKFDPIEQEKSRNVQVLGRQLTDKETEPFNNREIELAKDFIFTYTNVYKDKAQAIRNALLERVRPPSVLDDAPRGVDPYEIWYTPSRMEKIFTDLRSIASSPLR